jgi:hypothetical protein
VGLGQSATEATGAASFRLGCEIWLDADYRMVRLRHSNGSSPDTIKEIANAQVPTGVIPAEIL